MRTRVVQTMVVLAATWGCEEGGSRHAGVAATSTLADSPSPTASVDPATNVPPESRHEASTSSGSARCPAGEVFIPATGPEGFVMGAESLGNAPERRVSLTRPFCMDATEVTVAAYKACVDAGSCKPPRTWGVWLNYPTKLEHPVNKVSWRSARAYCRQRGQELPTEAQWEWAATGGDGRPWPWGHEAPTCEHADFTPGVLEGPASNDGCRAGGTSPVGSTPKGARRWPGGELHDLAGNVWEWTLDSFAPNGHIPKGTPETDPVVTLYEGGLHVTRGGGWNRSGKGIRSQFRAGSPVEYQVPGLGFRCVRPLERS